MIYKPENDFKKHLILLLAAVCLVMIAVKAFALPSIPSKEAVLKNKSIKLVFDDATGNIISFFDLKASLEFLHPKGPSTSLWKLELEEPAGARLIDATAAREFYFSKPDEHTLVLEWSGFSGVDIAELKVKVIIRLQENQSLSAWNISLSGIAGKQPERIIFPVIGGLQNMGNEELAVPVWTGELYKSPRVSLLALKGPTREYTWSYPGLLSLQMLSLYNPATHGFYAACNDTESYAKQFSFSQDSLNNLTYQMVNYPVNAAGNNVYTLPYDAIIGAFSGDWITAAEIYREWGVQQQWCINSRFRNRLDASWADSTALWVWNRNRSGNVLTPALDMKKRLGLPVNVLWHWWHGCLYDDGFPEYFPPREGELPFKAAVDNARRQGVRALIYMNSFQWGTSTQSFENEGAVNWAVKNKAGNTEAHVYNIFTHHSLTPMCMGTSFWRNKYAGLANKAINEYRIGGIYMDQACLHYRCYDKSHGHPTGGGNFWVPDFGQLANTIRANDRVKEGTVLAGEGCGESWLPHLDAFLTLQVSKGRYAGVSGAVTIPLFQAVYHQYAITFGSYSSLVSPPYDELWPKEYAPENQEQPLAEEFSTQFLMEQARAFVWGQQPTIANYHEALATDKQEEIDYLISLAQTRYKGLKYLLHGKFVRAPHTAIPEETIAISRLSIYAGQKDRVTRMEMPVPVLYTGAWKADDGDLGIAVASIANDTQTLRFTFKSGDYGLPPSGKVYVVDAVGRKLLTTYQGGKVHILYELPAKSVRILEVVRE